MKNPFKRSKRGIDSVPLPSAVQMPAESDPPVDEPSDEPSHAPAEKAPDDGFTEWCRSRVRGGIERRERNDIFEGYNVYGADAEGHLICRRWHRYPEHEKDFGLSYSRVLSFGDFNRRLLAELDKGDLALSDYRDAITRAEEREGIPAEGGGFEGFSSAEKEAIRAFCDSLDNLKDKTYLTVSEIFRCECESAAGGERLTLWFRKALRHDALNAAIPGVAKEAIYGYDIDDLWIMGVYNRLSERTACRVTRITNEWGAQPDAICLFTAAGLPGVDGELLIAVSGSDSFARFGFYSLDYASK